MHAEIKGRGRSWTVWIPDAGQMAHTVPLYDQEGNVKEMLLVGSPPEKGGVKYVQCYGGPFSSIEEADEYARYLGFTEVKVSKTMTKQEALAKARQTRQKGE